MLTVDYRDALLNSIVPQMPVVVKTWGSNTRMFQRVPWLQHPSLLSAPVAQGTYLYNHWQRCSYAAPVTGMGLYRLLLRVALGWRFGTLRVCCYCALRFV